MTVTATLEDGNGWEVPIARGSSVIAVDGDVSVTLGIPRADRRRPWIYRGAGDVHQRCGDSATVTPRDHSRCHLRTSDPEGPLRRDRGYAGDRDGDRGRRVWLGHSVAWGLAGR